MPDFYGIDSVPVGSLSFRQKKIDGGAGSPTAVRFGVTVSFNIVAAFGMGTHPESGDDVGGARGEAHDVGGRVV